MKQDSGTSSAIAFLLIVAALLILLGTWAVVALPNQIHEDEEKSIMDAVSTMTETKLMMNAAAENRVSQIFVYSHLPKGSLTTGSSGTLSINGRSIPIRHLILDTGDSAVGITANGIWRKDGNDAAWTSFPKLEGDTNSLKLAILTFEGDISYGSSEMIPFCFSYERTRQELFSDTEIILTFASEYPWAKKLWKTFFQELAYQQEEFIEVAGDSMRIVGNSGNVTLVLTEHVYLVQAGGEI